MCDEHICKNISICDFSTNSFLIKVSLNFFKSANIHNTTAAEGRNSVIWRAAVCGEENFAHS